MSHPIKRKLVAIQNAACVILLPNSATEASAARMPMDSINVAKKIQPYSYEHSLESSKKSISTMKMQYTVK